MYNGIIDCLVKTVRNEGVLACYKGFMPTVAGGIPYLGMSLGLYDIWKGLLLPGGADCVYGMTAKEDKEVWWFQFAKLGVGAWNGVVSQTAAYPLDTIRRRMALDAAPGQAKMYSSSMDCFRKVIANEGAGALYNGCGVNALKAMPGAAIQFYCYDFLSAKLRE